jgi:hypothetical protein
MWDPPTSRLHDVQYMQQNGPFKFRLETALLGATKTSYLANQHGAWSHAQRTGNVYKRGCLDNWATLFLGDINTGTWPSRLGVSQMRQ